MCARAERALAAMRPSRELFWLSLLAVVAAATATLCVEDVKGIITQYPVKFVPVHISVEKDIFFKDVCPQYYGPTFYKVGLQVVACSDTVTPTVTIKDLDTAVVDPHYTVTTVQGVIYCSPPSSLHGAKDGLPLNGLGLPAAGPPGPIYPLGLLPLHANQPAGLPPALEAVPLPQHLLLH